MMFEMTESKASERCDVATDSREGETSSAGDDTIAQSSSYLGGRELLRASCCSCLPEEFCCWLEAN